MDLEMIELKLFAQNIFSDVSVYYLKNYSTDGERYGYTDPRCSLFSKFGQLTIIQYLKDEFDRQFTALENNQTLRRVDDNVFDNFVTKIIAENEKGHAAFYKTCARIAIFGIFAIFKGTFTVSKINEAIVKIARGALQNYSLHPIYDKARKNAQTIVCSFYKNYDTNIRLYFTPIENAIGWTELKFENKFDAFIRKALPLTLKGIADFPDLYVTDEAKFDLLVGRFLVKFFLHPDTKKSKTNDNILYLSLSLCFVSVHCEITGFENGIRKMIEIIVQLFILEKKHKYMNYFSSDYVEQ